METKVYIDNSNSGCKYMKNNKKFLQLGYSKKIMLQKKNKFVYDKVNLCFCINCIYFGFV